MKSGRRTFAVGALALLVLAGCDPLSPAKTPFNAIDLTGADYGRELSLTDHVGKLRRLADFKGKVVVVNFGFTHCPDVCPTTLADFAKAIKQLGKDGERVQVLFVTLDPARDTPEVLKQYAPAFNPNFLGLAGSEEATRKVAKDFHVFYEKVPGKDGGDYSIDHTAGSYVYDPQGRLRLFVNFGMAADKIAADLALLLR